MVEVEFVWIEAELVEDGGVEVFDFEGFFDGGGAEFVGLAEADSAFDSASGHPHGEAGRVVIAAGSFGVFGGGLSAEFSAPDDEGFVEEAALFEIFEKSGDGFVGVAGVFVVVVFEVAVGVPVVVVMCAAGIELDEGDAAFDEAAGEEAFFSEVGGAVLVEAVEFFGVLAFFVEVDGFGRG